MESRWNVRRWTARRTICGAALALLVVLGGCGRSNDHRSSKMAEAPSTSADLASGESGTIESAPTRALATVPSPQATPPATPGSRQEIIYSGDITLEIDDLDKIVNEVTRI